MKKSQRSNLWRGFASVNAFLLTVLIFGTSVAFNYVGAINTALGVQSSKLVSDSTGDNIYYKSEFGAFQ